MENFEQQYRQREALFDARAERLVAAVTQSGRQEDLFRAAEIVKFRDQLYKEFHIDG